MDGTEAVSTELAAQHAAMAAAGMGFPMQPAPPPMEPPGGLGAQPVGQGQRYVQTSAGSMEVSDLPGGVLPQEQNVICAFNLPHQTQDDQLREFFERFGAVEKVYTIREKLRGSSRCKGYAFVYFADAAGAMRAREHAGGEKFQGRAIRVDFSLTAKKDQPEAPPSDVLCVFGLPGQVSNADVQAAFGERSAQVHRVDLVREKQTGRCKGYGFVYFPDVESARQTKLQFPYLMIHGHMVRVDYSLTTEPRSASKRGGSGAAGAASAAAAGPGAVVGGQGSYPRGSRPCNVLGCFGLPRETTEDDIRGLFARFGQVFKVDVVTDSVRSPKQCKGYAFAYFSTLDAAVEVYQQCTQGGFTPTVRGQAIRVDYSLTTAPPQTRQTGRGGGGGGKGGSATPPQQLAIGWAAGGGGAEMPMSPASPLSLPNDSFAADAAHDAAALPPPAMPPPPAQYHAPPPQHAAAPQMGGRRGRKQRGGQQQAAAARGVGPPPALPGVGAGAGAAAAPEPETLDFVSRMQVLTEAEISRDLEQMFPLPKAQLEMGRWGNEYVRGYEESRLDMLRLLDGYLRVGKLQWGAGGPAAGGAGAQFAAARGAHPDFVAEAAVPMVPLAAGAAMFMPRPAEEAVPGAGTMLC